MSLAVFVLGRKVAQLEARGDFKSALTYLPDVAAEDLVSLTMRVRAEAYIWDDTLHPIFQMNLPEGYLLQVLQEQFGPVIGASPQALLAVIGRNMIGRVQVAADSASLELPATAIDVAQILQGDNSEQAFAELVRQHASSGVSGVVPKFLHTDLQLGLKGHKKTSLLTRKYIIKGSSRSLPFVSLNEHLCMQVVSKVLPAAKTEVSDDGQALLVHRFDVDENGGLHWGMEDFCALLGLRPAAKYETTWERIAKAVRDLVPVTNRLQVFRQLSKTLLLTYALRNADCHAKNIALRYSHSADVHLSPVFDMVSTSVYANYQNNPPAISFMGKKTWAPGKHLHQFISATFGVPLREQIEMIEAISQAIVEVAPNVRDAMREHKNFSDIGKRILLAWEEGIHSLRDKRVFAIGSVELGEAFAGFSEPKKHKTEKSVVGKSELLGKKR